MYKNMEDLFKKFLYTGVGLVALTAEKIQKTVDRLVSEDKLTTDEGKKIVDEFVKNTQTKKEEFETQLRSITEKVIRSFDFATAHELNELKKRVEALEAKMNGSKPTVKTATKAAKKETSEKA
jgi:polyhydroxyalkanoate synthesis regulator phasin